MYGAGVGSGEGEGGGGVKGYAQKNRVGCAAHIPKPAPYL